jgi:hypothetical protein
MGNEKSFPIIFPLFKKRDGNNHGNYHGNYYGKNYGKSHFTTTPCMCAKLVCCLFLLYTAPCNGIYQLVGVQLATTQSFTVTIETYLYRDKASCWSQNYCQGMCDVIICNSDRTTLPENDTIVNQYDACFSEWEDQ